MEYWIVNDEDYTRCGGLPGQGDKGNLCYGRYDKLSDAVPEYTRLSSYPDLGMLQIVQVDAKIISKYVVVEVTNNPRPVTVLAASATSAARMALGLEVVQSADMPPNWTDGVHETVIVDDTATMI